VAEANAMRAMVDIGQVYRKVGSGQARIWRVVQLRDLPEGLHAKLVQTDDHTTTITLAVSALTNPRMFERLENLEQRE
jgi:hypothetical protein